MLKPDTLCPNTQAQNSVRYTVNVSSNYNLHLTMPLSSVSCSSKQFRRIQHTRIQHYIECRFLPWQDFFSFRFFLVISSFLHFCTSPAYFRQGLWLVAALCIIGCCFKINTNYVKWHNWHNNVQCNKRTDRFYCLFFHTGHQPENHMVGNPIVYISVIVCLREHLFVVLGIF